jgi:hypothetical protein
LPAAFPHAVFAAGTSRGSLGIKLLEIERNGTETGGARTYVSYTDSHWIRLVGDRYLDRAAEGTRAEHAVDEIASHSVPRFTLLVDPARPGCTLRRPTCSSA